jgi:hypothetical protein
VLEEKKFFSIALCNYRFLVNVAGRYYTSLADPDVGPSATVWRIQR